MQVPLLDLTRQYISIKDEIDGAMASVLQSQRFILGPVVEQFEKQIAEYCGIRHAIGCASGSDALLLALMAAAVGAGDEVITTPFSFFASTSCIVRLGARPVFVDIDPGSFNIDAREIADALTPRTKAILPVHLFGQCADMEPMLELARERNLVVVEDAAQALGAEYKGRRAGTIGQFGCFSFYPSKNLGGFGDGGLVTANDDGLADQVKLLREHGARPAYIHKMVGINSRLDALQAAVLSVKLKYLDEWTIKRQEHARYYDRQFAGVEEVIAPRDRGYGRHVYNQYVVQVPRRDELVEALQKKGIGSQIYYPHPLHLQECFKFLGYREGDLPVAEEVCKRVVALPVFPELRREELDYVVDALKGFFA